MCGTPANTGRNIFLKGGQSMCGSGTPGNTSRNNYYLIRGSKYVWSPGKHE